MDPSVKTDGQPSPTPRHEFTMALAWPVAVQISVVLAITATLFFLIGRWSIGSSTPAEAAERVGPALDLNRATKAELRLVPGLGDALSQRVIDYRERSGGFRSLDDLRQVHGIGPKILERIRPHLFIADVPIAYSRNDSGMLPSQAVMAPSQNKTASKKESLLTSAINVNRADQAELQKLPGIGPKLSQRILDERGKAPFKSIDDLRRVSGIGPKTLEKLRPYVTIE
jgi:competence protein ComEA